MQQSGPELEPVRLVPRQIVSISQDAETTILNWLEGKYLPELRNKRVIIFSWGDKVWLGHQSDEDHTFFDKYVPIEGQLRQTPLDLAVLGDQWFIAAKKLGHGFMALRNQGRIIQVDAPDQYDRQGSGAIFYALPN